MVSGNKWTNYCLKILSLFLLISLISCNKDESEIVISDSQKTLFIYMPWSNNLTSYFYTNLNDLGESIVARGLTDERIIVFFSVNASEAELFEMVYKNGKVTRESIKTYYNPSFTTATGITSIISDMKQVAPAKVYSMIIGSHGMGWLPVDNKQSRSVSDFKPHWEYENVPLTRYFGGTSPEYQTEVSTLSEGIVNAGIKMEYILFDDCYMSGIEVGYELRYATDHIIASTSEIMAYGMPYAIIGEYLLGTPDYQKICDGFYQFYSTYQYPYGTLGVIDCREIDALVPIMREINSNYQFDASLISSLQRLDGYSPTIFFDFGDYVDKLCHDEALKLTFMNQLQRVVPNKTHIGAYYSMKNGVNRINTFSGITISDPSISNQAIGKVNTPWYVATH